MKLKYKNTTLLIVTLFLTTLLVEAQTFIPCGFCNMTGKQIKPMPCNNCSSWNNEYKRKVACHVCKDKREVPPHGKCIICEGAGKVNLSELTGTKPVTKKANLKKEPKETYYKRAAQNLADGNYEAALENCNNEILLYPGQVDVYVIRGMARLQLYDFGGAIEDANKAIDISPSYAEAFFLRGIVKRRITDKPGACSDFRKAVQLGSKGAKSQIETYCDTDAIE